MFALNSIVHTHTFKVYNEWFDRKCEQRFMPDNEPETDITDNCMYDFVK